MLQSIIAGKNSHWCHFKNRGTKIRSNFLSWGYYKYISPWIISSRIVVNKPWSKHPKECPFIISLFRHIFIQVNHHIHMLKWKTSSWYNVFRPTSKYSIILCINNMHCINQFSFCSSHLLLLVSPIQKKGWVYGSQFRIHVTTNGSLRYWMQLIVMTRTLLLCVG